MNEDLKVADENISPIKATLTNPQTKEKGFFRELVEFVIIALIIVIPFRIFIAQPFVVNGASMDPTFENGEYLIVYHLSYIRVMPYALSHTKSKNIRRRSYHHKRGKPGRNRSKRALCGIREEGFF